MSLKKENKFKIELIASVIEVCYLTEPDAVLDFCSYVLGYEVEPGNMRENHKLVCDVLKEQYPTLKRKTFIADGCVLKPHEIIELVNKYREEFGDYLVVKSNKEKSKSFLKLRK